VSVGVSWSHHLRSGAGAWRGVLLSVAALARHGGAILGLCGIVFLWGGVLHALSDQREQALRGATANAANLARTFEEDIIRSIRAVDQTLLYVREAYARDPAHFDIVAWAKNTQFLTDLTFQVSLIDKSGLLVGSSLGPVSGHMDLSDREHFKVHRDTQGDTLFVSKPVLGRESHKWSIQMTRKIIASDGSFDGVAVVSLDPQYLSRFYNSVDVGGGGSVTLVGTDGIVRARAAAGDISVGQSLIGGSLLAHYARTPIGTYQAASTTDGAMKIYAYRGVRSYPLIVVVGMAETEALANYAANRRSYLIVATALTVLLLIVTMTIMHRDAGLRRARAKLRASEAKHAQKSRLLEAAVENMSQGIMMIGADRKVQICNRRAMQQLDLPQTLMAGDPFDDVLRWQWETGEFGPDGGGVEGGGVESGDAESWLRGFVRRGGVSDEAQSYERTRPDGRVLEIQSTPLRDGGIVRTYTDITERKETERVLRLARDEADRSARAKSEFLAMMSHEIRSPMNGLLGIVELLRETPLEAEQASMVELAHASAAALLLILNDVLDFSKLDAGAVDGSLEPLALRPLVEALVDAVALPAGRKGVQVVAEWTGELPEWIISDALRLRQILGNLLSNAIKFTASGTVKVTVSLGVSASGAPVLGFAVSDTGIGMSAEVLMRLFEPFMQADASTTKNFGGTGLGLSISRRLARVLGGDIEVTSEQGVGSVFTLVVPLVVAPTASIPLVSISAELASIGLADGALRGLRVLLAEDQETNRWLMRRQFARFEVILEVVEDGHQAFAAFQRTTFDLLVTDCHMPGMDGVELVQCIRAVELSRGGARLPILGLTADITSEMHARCLGAGMDDVVSKPINLRQLEAALRRIVVRDGCTTDAAAVVDDDALFDPGTYLELFGNDLEEGAEWLDGFIEAAVALIDAMSDGIRREDRTSLQAAAHRLAGTALSAGAMRVGMLARKMETLAAEGATAALDGLQGLISDSFDATRGEIRGQISSKVAVVQ
jgi:signal transduction histidine kinase/CheY-like chemotaxis protein/HPt (histidine-containing phosphotransfer) domain-containing protein